MENSAHLGHLIFIVRYPSILLPHSIDAPERAPLHTWLILGLGSSWKMNHVNSMYKNVYIASQGSTSAVNAPQDEYQPIP